MEPTAITIMQNIAVVPEVPEYINPALIHFILIIYVCFSLIHHCQSYHRAKLYTKLQQNISKFPLKAMKITPTKCLIYGTQLNSFHG